MTKSVHRSDNAQLGIGYGVSERQTLVRLGCPSMFINIYLTYLPKNEVPIDNLRFQFP